MRVYAIWVHGGFGYLLPPAHNRSLLRDLLFDFLLHDLGRLLFYFFLDVLQGRLLLKVSRWANFQISVCARSINHKSREPKMFGSQDPNPGALNMISVLRYLELPTPTF